MERQEFLSKLGLGLAVVCTGCSLVSCGSKMEDPGPTTGGGGGTGGGAPLTVDLSTRLANIGDSVVVGVGSAASVNGYNVVRIADGNTPGDFAALTATCTHMQGILDYSNATQEFTCRLHQNVFKLDGTRVATDAPPAAAIQVYNVTISGNTLTVSA